MVLGTSRGSWVWVKVVGVGNGLKIKEKGEKKSSKKKVSSQNTKRERYIKNFLNRTLTDSQISLYQSTNQ